MPSQDFEAGRQRWDEMVERVRRENPTWDVAHVNQYAYNHFMVMFGEVYCPVGVIADSLNR